METNETMERELNIEYGLCVDFDGEKNIILHGEVYEYPIGGMLCELGNVDLPDIKTCIMKLELFDEESTVDNISASICELEKIFEKEFGVAAAIVLTSEFMIHTENYIRNKDDLDSDIYEVADPDDEIYKYIFEETPFTGIGDSSVGHVLLTSYFYLSQYLAIFKALFLDLMKEDEDGEEERTYKLMPLFGILQDGQEIDFRFVAMDKDIKALYTIKTAVSLLAFEFVHSLKSGTIFQQCKNCGKYFVVTGRKDTVYCDNPSPNHEGKTCREIGAQVTRANKEKNDETTREYRKTYMRLKMQSNRHPKDDTLRDKVDKLVLEGKKSRDKLESGEITAEEYMEWLRNFDS